MGALRWIEVMDLHGLEPDQREGLDLGGWTAQGNSEGIYQKWDRSEGKYVIFMIFLNKY